jgi:hypothetical protein
VEWCADYTEVKTQPKNAEYFDCLDSMITNGARCTGEVNCRIVKAKAAFHKEENLHKQIGRKLKEETGEVLHLMHDCVCACACVCGAETWTVGKVDQKYLESVEMWYCGRLEKISWTDRARNKEI